MERAEAPTAARAAVELMNGYTHADWPRVADAADQLVPGVSAGERWVPPDLLLDLAVLAYLEMGRPEAARNAIAGLMPRTGRVESNLRNRLLRALVDEAER